MRTSLPILLAMALGGASAYAVSIPGNMNTGFGGPVGEGTLDLTPSGSTINGTFTNGATTSGFNDDLVLYIDSVAGGFADTSNLTDTADEGRKAVSVGTTDVVAFDSGFEADYGIAMDSTFGGSLFELADSGSHGFVDSVNVSPTGDANATEYTFDFDFSEIGISQGTAFNVVGIYMNAADTPPFLSDEGFATDISGGNPGTEFGTLTLTGSQAVPEPSTYALIGGVLALGAAILRRRRG